MVKNDMARLNKEEKERLEEIEVFFRALEEKTEKYRKYYAALATLPQEPPKKRVFVEYGSSATSQRETKNA